MKRFIALFLSLVMIVGVCGTAYADPEEEFSIDIEQIEEYAYTDYLRSELSISNKTATCKSVVIGLPSLTTEIKITQTLEMKSGSVWLAAKTWEHTYYSWYATFVNSKSSLSSGTYRVRTMAKVYSGTNYEVINVYSSLETC